MVGKKINMRIKFSFPFDDNAQTSTSSALNKLKLEQKMISKKIINTSILAQCS